VVDSREALGEFILEERNVLNIEVSECVFIGVFSDERTTDCESTLSDTDGIVLVIALLSVSVGVVVMAGEVIWKEDDCGSVTEVEPSLLVPRTICDERPVLVSINEEVAGMLSEGLSAIESEMLCSLL